MVVVRGVNVFPSAIEGVLREFPDVSEFRIEVFPRRSMVELRVLVDPRPGSAAGLAELVANRLRERLLLVCRASWSASGSLPRFELKARRVVHLPD